MRNAGTTRDQVARIVTQGFGLNPTRPPLPVTIGLIHETWRVETEEGPFVLQGLHPALDRPEILRDTRRVTEHLAAKGAVTPRLRLTREGALAYAEGGRRWRLMTFVPGEVFVSLQSPVQARAAGAVLGRFHRLMWDFPHPLETPHPLHRTDEVLDGLRRALASPAGRALRDRVEEPGEFLLDLLPSLIPPDLPRRVVHGDPKISNVLFVPGRGGAEALCMIDLDTVNRHTRLADLGDAARSWCRSGREDEPSPFDLERFEALLEGYGGEAPGLDPDEKACLAHAPRWITLELAARFLTDAIEDRYFGWDPRRYPDRRSHNLARLSGCLALAASMAEALAAMAGAVARSLP